MIQEIVPLALGLLVLSGTVAASLSTSDGAVLGTYCVFARNVFGIREEQGGTEADKLLLTARIMAVPVTLLGIFFALRIPETGIMLTLAFDVLFASLLIPFALGVYWPKANKPAAIAAIIIGGSTRLAFFVLTPTTYGVENTLAYIPNETFTAAFDGLPTFISPLLGLFTFVVLALATQDTYEPAVKDVKALVTEDGPVAEPMRVCPSRASGVLAACFGRDTERAGGGPCWATARHKRILGQVAEAASPRSLETSSASDGVMSKSKIPVGM